MFIWLEKQPTNQSFLSEIKNEDATSLCQSQKFVTEKRLFPIVSRDLERAQLDL